MRFLFNIWAVKEHEQDVEVKSAASKGRKVFEAPRAQNYYHLEYSLLPDNDELVKTDVVVYGIAAKLYLEMHDPRMIKAWHDGEVTWIAWTHW